MVVDKISLNKQKKRKNNNIISYNAPKVIQILNQTQNLNSYINYINFCNSLKRLNKKKKIRNKYPFLSICVCVNNIEQYVERAILSIINQSFQNFEIVIINDFSNDNTYNIIMRLSFEDNRIKIINHKKNLGTYYSRVEAVFYSKGKYILYLDPDDMFLNQNLFSILYNYNFYNNLDIIEFTVMNQREENGTLFTPKNHIQNHNHNYSKKFIYQPELSEIIFYKYQSKNISQIICRTLWNKLIRKSVLLNSIKYIGKDYFQKEYIIVVEDTILNVINFHFANNYSNINVPGYMYNIRNSSISHKKGNNKHIILRSISFYLYFKLLYKYINEFNKNRDILYYELKKFKNELLNFKNYKVMEYILNTKNFLIEIKKDNKISKKLKKFLNILLKQYK